MRPTMRAVFSLLALLIVVFVVMKLTTSQIQAIAPVKPGGGAASSAAEQAAAKVQQALEQGAALRAVDAASH
jgi:hypothetical protein